MRFSRSFTVEGITDKIFELTKSFMLTINFDLEQVNKPDSLKFKRETYLPLLITNSEDYKTELNISFKQKGKKLHILCDYNVTAPEIETSIDSSTLESEVDQLEFFLKTFSWNEINPKRESLVFG